MASTDSVAPASSSAHHAPSRSHVVWIGLVGAIFTLAMALAYPPTLATGEALPAALPWLALIAMALTLRAPALPHRLAALAVAIGAWATLMVVDERWTLLSIAVYILCFTVDPARSTTGVLAAGVASATWMAASLLGGQPSWTLLLPPTVLATGATLSVAMHRTARMAEEQASLVRSLRATREDLAAANRARGVLEERARMAAEIHDSLAQGFTSIVLLARGASRSADPDASPPQLLAELAGIEQAAQASLADARRIVAASTPPEMLGRRLEDVLAHHLDAVRGQGLDADFRAVGDPRDVPEEVRATLLRALQEAIRNIRLHANATTVEAVLSWGDDRVVLEVRDDGVGMVRGSVQDRGPLTGGQGLATLARRVEALGGTATIESSPGEGTSVTACLPVAAP